MKKKKEIRLNLGNARSYHEYPHEVDFELGGDKDIMAAILMLRDIEQGLSTRAAIEKWIPRLKKGQVNVCMRIIRAVHLKYLPDHNNHWGEYDFDPTAIDEPEETIGV